MHEMNKSEPMLGSRLWCFSSTYPPAGSFPLGMFTLENVCLAFRLFARCGAAVRFYIHERNQRYPFKMFGVLDASQQEQVAKEICKDYATCPCVMDSFSRWHMDEHMERGGLLGNLSIEELKIIAAQLDTDISTTECQHASNRRAVESKSVHTHQLKLSEASSQFVCRSLRNSSAVGFHGFKHAPPKRAGTSRMKPGPRPKERARKYKKRVWKVDKLVRGGGAWAVFVSKHHFSVQPCTPEGRERMKQLSEEYKSLTPEQLAPLREEAFKARQASRFGNKGLIGKMKRKEREQKRKQKMLADGSGSGAAKFSRTAAVPTNLPPAAIADVDRPQCSDLLPVHHGNQKAPKVAAYGRSMELEQVLRQGQLANMEASQHKLAEAQLQQELIKAAATNMETASPLVAALKDNSPDFPTASEDFDIRAADGLSNLVFKPATASTPVPITPAVPGARSLLAADVSSASMFSAWNSLLSKSEELCWKLFQSTINEPNETEHDFTDSQKPSKYERSMKPASIIQTAQVVPISAIIIVFLLLPCSFIHSLAAQRCCSYIQISTF